MDALKQQVLKDGLVLGPEIGRGSFGVVYRCTDIKTQINYAVKKIDLRTLRMQPNFVLARLKRECTVLQGLQHPSVVRLFKTIEADDAVLMVMEMVLGMELFDLILAVSGLGESEACAVFIQIASALAYMHSKGVIHRDIKPENILIQGTTSGSQDHDMGDTVISDTFQHLNPRVKLIDFGLSKSLGNNSPEGSIAKSLVGTPRYVAPEILAIGEKMQKTNRDLQPSQEPLETLSYTEKVDCYSTGVLLHVMLSACFPQFEGKQELIFADPRVANVSNEAKDLISKLMLNDPNERISIKDALCHPWVKRHHPRAAIAASRLAGVSVGPSPPVSPKHRDSQQLGASYLSPRPSKQLPFETKRHASSTPMQVEGEDDSLRPSGLKRQISTPDPLDNHNLEARTRTQSLNSKSGSKSSIETLNLPGSVKGVWGPYIESSDTPEGTPERGYKTSSHQRSIEESEESLEFRPSPEQSKAQIGSSAMDVEADRGTTSRDRKRDAEDSNDGQGESREALVPRLNNAINSHGTDEISMGSFKGEAIANPEILLQLQTRIAKCFHQSFNAFKDDDVVSPGIVSSAVASRELLGASETIVKKLEQTSLSVLDLLPDMVIAVEEGEFGMAVTCFDTIKEWIRAIQAESQELLKANVKVIASVNNTLQLARRRQRVKEATEAGFRVSDALALEAEFQNELRPTSSIETGTKGGAIEAAQAGERESTDALKRHELQEILQERQSSDQSDPPKGVAESMRNQLRLAEHRREAQIKSQLETHKTPRSGLHRDHLETTTALVPAANGDLMVVENEGERSNREIEPITNALAMLQQIDHLLQQHASFWTHMELVVDVLMQRANHVESMVNFTRNPRLRGRFLERVHEYSSMWTRMTQMCQQFHRDSNRVEGGKLYQFLRDL